MTKHVFILLFLATGCVSTEPNPDVGDGARDVGAVDRGSDSGVNQPDCSSLTGDPAACDGAGCISLDIEVRRYSEPDGCDPVEPRSLCVDRVAGDDSGGYYWRSVADVVETFSHPVDFDPEGWEDCRVDESPACSCNRLWEEAKRGT